MGHWSGRIETAALAAAIAGGPAPAVYVCGPTAFVETVATALGRGCSATANIRTERFG